MENKAKTIKVRDIRKIVIIQTAFIGDTILTLSLLRESKKIFSASVDIVVVPASAELLQCNQEVDKVVIYDKRGKNAGWCGFWRTVKNLRSASYDLALVPHRSLRSALLAVFCGAKYRVGFDKSAGAWLFHRRIKYRPEQHEVERNLSLLMPWADEIDDSLHFMIDTKYEAETLVSFSDVLNLKPVVGFAPGSVWPTKRWPVEHFRDLAKQLVNEDTRVILIGGKDDRTLGQVIKLAVPKVINLIGITDLCQAAVLIKHMDLLVTNDSAPLHLASALHTPVVALFGPTVKEFGFTPYQIPHKVVERSLSCRPCSRHGSYKCPIGTHECLKEILPQQVHKILKELQRD
ncbi:lipopolysaccharide heptosyltransferase II [candidate division KSB1 bacterium]|nr:lipopolysaccharide heptosyltransferase II [candidate division KSB1 bacterium]